MQRQRVAPAFQPIDIASSSNHNIQGGRSVSDTIHDSFMKISDLVLNKLCCLPRSYSTNCETDNDDDDDLFHHDRSAQSNSTWRAKNPPSKNVYEPRRIPSPSSTYRTRKNFEKRISPPESPSTVTTVGMNPRVRSLQSSFDLSSTTSTEVISHKNSPQQLYTNNNKVKSYYEKCPAPLPERVNIPRRNNNNINNDNNNSRYTSHNSSTPPRSNSSLSKLKNPNSLLMVRKKAPRRRVPVKSYSEDSSVDNLVPDSRHDNHYYNSNLRYYNAPPFPY